MLFLEYSINYCIIRRTKGGFRVAKKRIYTYSTDIFDLEECQSRIQEALKSENYRSDGYKGWVNLQNHSFRLWQKTPYKRNSFSRKFYGKLVENGQGTVIQGYFKVDTFASILVVFYYCILLAGCLLSLTSDSSAFLSILPNVVLMGLLGFAIVFIGLRYSASHERNVLSFLESTVLASKVSK